MSLYIDANERELSHTRGEEVSSLCAKGDTGDPVLGHSHRSVDLVVVSVWAHSQQKTKENLKKFITKAQNNTGILRQPSDAIGD